MSAQHEVHWEFPIPPEARGVDIVFAPTRSRIVQARAEVVGGPRIPVDIARRGDVWVRVEWASGPVQPGPVPPGPPPSPSPAPPPPPPPPGRGAPPPHPRDRPGADAPPSRLKLVLDLMVEGEGLQQPMVFWIITTAALSDDDEAWEQIYKARAELTDDQQQCMFEIDRNTLPSLIDHCPDLNATEKAYRRNDIAGGLGSTVVDRLRNRWYNAPGSPIPDRSRLVFVTDLFAVAESKLSPPNTLATTLEHFAAGDLRAVIGYGVAGQSFNAVVTEPDSYYAFLFAEVALACLEATPPVSPTFWEPMLPSLMKMQAYYLDRVNPPALTYVCQYTDPIQLQPPNRTSIDADYAAARPKPQWETKMYEKLREASNIGFCG